MGSGVRTGTSTPLGPETTRSASSSTAGMSGNTSTDSRSSNTNAGLSGNTSTDSRSSTSGSSLSGTSTDSRSSTTSATYASAGVANSSIDSIATSADNARGVGSSATTDSRSTASNYNFPPTNRSNDTMVWNSDSRTVPLLDRSMWVPTIGLIRGPVTRDPLPEIDARITNDISRGITRPELPHLLMAPSGFTCYHVLTEDFNDVPPGSVPLAWTGGSGVDISVTNEVSYTYPNSLRLTFPTGVQIVPVSRSLAPWLALSDTRPLILQFFVNFGVAQTKGGIVLSHKAEVNGIVENTLLKIFRTSREQAVQIKKNDVSLAKAVSISQYYYEDRPNEVYFGSDGALKTMKPLDDVKNVRRSMNTVRDPAVSLYTNELVEHRTTQVETFRIEYGDVSGNIVTGAVEIQPYSTERGSRLKLLGWNAITMLCFSETFNLYINETLAVEGGYYTDYLDAGTEDRYLGVIKVGGVGATTRDTIGTIFLDHMSVYALKPDAALPEGWEYRHEVPIILTDTQLPAEGSAHQTAVSGSSSQEFDEYGCLIVRMSEIQLYPDINGSFTWSNELDCNVKYTSVSDIQIDSAGRAIVGSSVDSIQRCIGTNVYIDIDGTMVVGGTLDNSLDTIPFDYEMGEFVFIGALITNDDARTPVLTKLSFEFD